MKSVFLQNSEIYPYNAQSFLKVTGEDSEYFLQSQFSNDLSGLDLGASIYGLWLDKKGHVLADSQILYVDSEHYWITSEHTEMRSIKAMLERHIIADDVVIEEIEILGCVALGNEQMDEFLSEINLRERTETKTDLLTGDFGFAFRGHRLADSGFEIYFTEPSAYQAFQSFVKDNKLCELSANAVNVRRIECGIPLIPDEIGPNDLAAEGDLVPSAASISKGCYLGQEVVSRLYNLGTPQRGLYVISFVCRDSVLDKQLPKDLYFESRKLGELKTLYLDPACEDKNTYIGVALLKERTLNCFNHGVLYENIPIQLERRLCLTQK